MKMERWGVFIIRTEGLEKPFFSLKIIGVGASIREMVV